MLDIAASLIERIDLVRIDVKSKNVNTAARKLQ